LLLDPADAGDEHRPQPEASAGMIPNTSESVTSGEALLEQDAAVSNGVAEPEGGVAQSDGMGDGMQHGDEAQSSTSQAIDWELSADSQHPTNNEIVSDSMSNHSEEESKKVNAGDLFNDDIESSHSVSPQQAEREVD